MGVSKSTNRNDNMRIYGPNMLFISYYLLDVYIIVSKECQIFDISFHLVQSGTGQFSPLPNRPHKNSALGKSAPRLKKIKCNAIRVLL